MKRYPNDITEIFAMLHPTMLPTIRLQLLNYKRDLEDEVDSGNKEALMVKNEEVLEAIDLLIAKSEDLYRATPSH